MFIETSDNSIITNIDNKFQLSLNHNKSDRLPFIIFYEHINFQGDEWSTQPGHSYSYVGDRWNDRISSFKIIGNATFRFHEHINFGGWFRDAANDVANVASMGVPQDRISSFQLLSISGHS